MSAGSRNLLQRLLRPDSLPLLLTDFAIVFLLGIVCHAFWQAATGAAVETDTAQTEHSDHETATGTLWTCSMHPQIIKNKPGNCPICGMKLIPLQMGGPKLTGLRQLVVSPEARALMNIQVTPVERRFVDATVRMVGKVDYDETRLKHITAYVPGRLDRLFVDYTGIRVSEGDHMVYIYSEELYAAQQELIAALRSQRQNATPDNSLFGDGGINLVDSAREKLRLLGLTKEQINEIESREKPSDHVMLYAPMGGIVIQKLKQEGDRVQVGERIYTVADLSQVWVKMDAYESDLMWLRYGQDVTFTTEAYPGEEFHGRIAFIDPVLDEKTRTVKVRVNVPNEDGRLKPEMFVRAVVRARVAAGGRVIDASLAGKWISPMHPEIVSDKPGKCPICGMPLVRAETLGYVSAEQAGTAAGLVIPASAPLLTGTRAVVYVELPDTEEPTFEGREIVLGPRVGDYYLVKHGLAEGELVVTAGNFKIDSALQIQARPSMMTPEGGGGGGGHHHGHDAHKPAAADKATPAMEHDVPISLKMKLQQIRKAFQQIQTATASGNRTQIHAAWRAMAQLVQSVDPDALTGQARMVWKELSMLLTNDAVEGSEVIDAEDAQRLLASASRTVQRLDRQFGLSHSGVPHHYDVPPEFRKQLAEIWKAYQKIGAALAADDPSQARSATSELKAAIAGVDMRLLTNPDAHRAWMRELANLQNITRDLAETDDLKIQREHFEALSAVVQVLALSFGFGDDATVYLHHCPMAFGNKGAYWLQADEKSRNPYFGATMLNCADKVERLSPVAAPDPKPTPAESTPVENQK